jgi:hypothetical protein
LISIILEDYVARTPKPPKPTPRVNPDGTTASEAGEPEAGAGREPRGDLFGVPEDEEPQS